MRRMVEEQENVFYYITTLNENYVQPPMPDGVEEGIIAGMYQLEAGPKTQGKKKLKRVQLLSSGSIMGEVRAAAELLLNDHGVAADIWSATSFNELGREAQSIQRWNMMHPDQKPRQSYVQKCLAKQEGPVIAATDYMKSYADQIRSEIEGTYIVLGTDGFGRSDSRENLRSYFEVDRYYVTYAALAGLVEQGELKVDVLKQAIKKYGIDPDKIDPVKA
jgi:pyruvate dehydrogenase E1 component